MRIKCEICGLYFSVAKDDDAPGDKHPDGLEECIEAVKKHFDRRFVKHIQRYHLGD